MLKRIIRFLSNVYYFYRHCCVLVITALISSTVIMTTAGLAISNQEKTVAALDTVLAKQCRFSGTFTQKRSLTSLPVPLKSDGQFLFDCELGLIWHIASPIVETKIYTLSSNHFQLNKKLNVKPLDSFIQTTIAELLLDIMSADKQAIANHFIISEEHSNGVLLIPSDTFLKKGIQSIVLKKVLENDRAQNGISIELLDSKSQNTHIHSIETHQSDSKEASLKNCQSLFSNNLVCNILENPNSYQPSQGH